MWKRRGGGRTAYAAAAARPLDGRVKIEYWPSEHGTGLSESGQGPMNLGDMAHSKNHEKT